LIPEIGEKYALEGGVPARRLATGRADLRQVINRDWQNAYADFSVNLKRQLEAIESAEKRADAIARMRKILDEFAAQKQRARRHA
jgi:metallo-beta-lactamase family protein